MLYEVITLPEAGHTGGGIGAVWRGIASMHLPPGREAAYRREMDILKWYYEISREPGGGFCMPACPPNGTRYANEVV